MRVLFLLVAVTVVNGVTIPNNRITRCIRELFSGYIDQEKFLLNDTNVRRCVMPDIHYEQEYTVQSIGRDHYIKMAVALNNTALGISDYNITEYQQEMFNESVAIVRMTTRSTHYLIAYPPLNWIVEDYHWQAFVQTEDERFKLYEHKTSTKGLAYWLKTYLGYNSQDPVTVNQTIEMICTKHELCGVYRVYNTTNDCINAMHATSFGEVYEFNRDTVGCRAFLSDPAKSDPQTYCADVFTFGNTKWCNDSNTYASDINSNFFPIPFTP